MLTHTFYVFWFIDEGLFLFQLEDVPLTSDYPKAWISTYIMLEQFLARRSIINSVIESIDPSSYEKDLVIITDDDWAVIEDVVTVLEPFKVFK